MPRHHLVTVAIPYSKRMTGFLSPADHDISAATPTNEGKEGEEEEEEEEKEEVWDNIIKLFSLTTPSVKAPSVPDTSPGTWQHIVGQIRKKHRINSHLINRCPMNSGVSERLSKASRAEQANE